MLREYIAPRAIAPEAVILSNSADSKSNTQSRPVLCLSTTTQKATRAGVKRPSSMMSITSRREAAIEGRIEVGVLGIASEISSGASNQREDFLVAARIEYRDSWLTTKI